MLRDVTDEPRGRPSKGEPSNVLENEAHEVVVITQELDQKMYPEEGMQIVVSEGNCVQQIGASLYVVVQKEKIMPESTPPISLTADFDEANELPIDEEIERIAKANDDGIQRAIAMRRLLLTLK
jgi:hypothetical protein